MEDKNKRTRYSMLSQDQRRLEIQRNSENRKRRKLEESRPSTSFSSPIHELKTKEPCRFCGAKKFENETPTFCCQNGQVHLVEPEAPEELFSLFVSQTDEGEHFRKNIRGFNSMFSFTSFGVHFDKKLATANKGVYTFRVKGQTYHDLPALLPEERPVFFQLYFYDTENEVENRYNVLSAAELEKPLIRKLVNIMQENPYARFFRSVGDEPSLEKVEIHIASNVNLDQRVYNTPTKDQVAAIWIEGNNQNIPFEREIVVHAHSGKKHRIQHYFSCYDSLQYPLLFPKGESGWHQNIKRQSPCATNNNQQGASVLNLQPTTEITRAEDVLRNEHQGVSQRQQSKVSCREYYCYKLQVRPGNKTILLRAGRLLQQFVVDMYIKLETTRLDFFRNQQSQIRSELYQGIIDTVNAGETRGDKIGLRKILPPTFIGGPRDMRRRYLDAMALVQEFKKPDIFLTMTCNSEWKEITDALLPGQTSQDRPDLASRVFRGKLMDLKDQIIKKEIFGKVAAFVYVIEFQKRGLPHAHMLIILKKEDKIMNADQYDKYVCAEIPDQRVDPLLHEAVVKHMLHGPCGNLNPKCPCMRNQKCRFKYPRQYSEKTVQGKDSYPLYRRRNDGIQVRKRNADLDNRWVVPYNPFLLIRYNCHINVEICSGLKAVKYLYKYIYKGHDRAAVNVTRDDEHGTVDEIQEFQDARWVSAQEAMWRMYEFPLNEISPPVITLQLHLPNQQMVTYWEKQDLRRIVQDENTSKTMLTEFFKICKSDGEAKKLLYRDFPKHYVWNKQNRKWTRRQRGTVVSRIASANPAEGERYYERILLNNIPGPESFEDLMKIGNVQYWTFKEAAQKRGLLESDQSIIECLDEASNFKMPRELRRLFATILTYCEPPDVRKLWELYFDPMSEDFERQNNSNIQERRNRTLREIETFLESMGKRISKYDLPRILSDEPEATITLSKEIVDELSIITPQEDTQASQKLNRDQREAYKVILERAENKKSGLFFIDGPGGTGKTYLYRAIMADLRQRGMIVLATATSGVAASILPGGRTAHSRFNIPLHTDETTVCHIPKQSNRAELIRKASLIIWDEAPMAKRTTIEAVDRTFRDIMDKSTPFGGKIIIFGGDFRQVLPVVPRATRQQTINESLARSYLWSAMEVLQLKTNMRAVGDPEFAEYLLRIGNGTEPTTGEDYITMPKQIIVTPEVDVAPEDSLIKTIYSELEMRAGSSEYITQRAILSTKNEYIDEINQKMIDLFPGERKEFVSYDSAVDDTGNYYQEEFLNTLLPNGIPPHRLLLKQNGPIMLLRNLDPANGLCNGSRLICKGFTRNLIHAEIATGEQLGKQVFIPRIPMSPANDEGYPFKFIRKQFPVRSCFAMTINKAQGQTIQKVGVYLPEHVFSHGQLYVALSRGISLEDTKVLIKAKNKRQTKNIVYKEILM